MAVFLKHALCACILFTGSASSHAVAADFAPAEGTTSTLTLQTVIRAALASNPELQGFTYQTRAAEARTRQAGLRPATEFSSTLENVLGTGENKRLNSAEATFALSQVIEMGGKRDARISAAAAARSSIDIERQAAQLDVLADVTRRFIVVAERQERLRLAKSATVLAEQTVVGAERRVRAAKSPHVELDRATIALSRARLGEQRAAIELETSRLQLAALWGESYATINGRPFGDIRADLYALPEIGDFAELTQRLAQNPDALRFASEARLRDAELRLAATLRKPDVTLGAGIRRLQATKDQALVASFSIPLFSGRRADGYIAEAQANRDLVDTKRRAALVRAEATLFELHQELRHAVTQATALKEQMLPKMDEAMKETEYAFQRGRYSYLELVDAQREYLAQQQELIEASANAHTLRAEIERLTNAPLTNVVNTTAP